MNSRLGLVKGKVVRVPMRAESKEFGIIGDGIVELHEGDIGFKEWFLFFEKQQQEEEDPKFLSQFDTDDEGHEGRWVTMRGRKVFIREGESAEEALDRSLKRDSGSIFSGELIHGFTREGKVSRIFEDDARLGLDFFFGKDAENSASGYGKKAIRLSIKDVKVATPDFVKNLRTELEAGQKSKITALKEQFKRGVLSKDEYLNKSSVLEKVSNKQVREELLQRGFKVILSGNVATVLDKNLVEK